MFENNSLISGGNNSPAPERTLLSGFVGMLLLVPIAVGSFDVIQRVAANTSSAADSAATISAVSDSSNSGTSQSAISGADFSMFSDTPSPNPVAGAPIAAENNTGLPSNSALQGGIIPDRLIIPAIHIDAHVQRLGINAKGAMQAPSNFIDVGWYQDGSRPGGSGSAVIDGHVNNALTTAGVFEHLGQLKAGDTIMVSDTAGKTFTFQVMSVNVYSADNAPTAEIFSHVGPSQLVLITCDGTWDAAAHQYNNRLVVYAKLGQLGLWTSS